jgi:hypothetical protein
MSLVLDIDDSPSVLPASNGFAVDNYTSLRANHSEWQHFLHVSLLLQPTERRVRAYPDPFVQQKLLVIVLIGVEGV